jgi:hypothetical protein
MNPDNLMIPPDLLWRQKLVREDLNDRDLRLIEEQLELLLYGYLKPEESIVGFRVLHEYGGVADLLLMRRDFRESGFFFDLDVALGRVGPEESNRLFAQVEETVARLTDQEPTGLQEPMGR